MAAASTWINWKFRCLVPIIAASLFGQGCPADSQGGASGSPPVILLPSPQAGKVALVVLFNIGSDQDPEGKSGLAHLCEHLYATAAAGATPARDIQTFMARYPDGWNAQTGAGFTVIATVFEPARLGPEIGEAADRMVALRPTQADLDREVPRVEEELSNMFGRIPQLAAANLAGERVRPSPRGGRKGGRPEQVRTITLAEANDWLGRYYKPSNAVIAVAGAFDAEIAGKLIDAALSRIPTGKPVPPPASAAGPVGGEVQVVKVGASVPGSSSVAGVAYRAPELSDRLYPSFMVLAARIMFAAGPAGMAVNFAPLDNPDVLAVTATISPGEAPGDVVKRIRKLVLVQMARMLEPRDIEVVKTGFGFFFGLGGLQGRLAQNPYGAAFAAGRRKQLGIDPASFKKSLETVRDEDLKAVARGVFSDKNSGAAAVMIEQ